MLPAASSRSEDLRFAKQRAGSGAGLLKAGDPVGPFFFINDEGSPVFTKRNPYALRPPLDEKSDIISETHDLYNISSSETFMKAFRYDPDVLMSKPTCSVTITHA